jgi:hypothetical protein
MTGLFHGGIMTGQHRSARRGAIARQAGQNHSYRDAVAALLLVALVLPAEYGIRSAGHLYRRTRPTAIASPPAAPESLKAPTNPEAASDDSGAARPVVGSIRGRSRPTCTKSLLAARGD